MMLLLRLRLATHNVKVPQRTQNMDPGRYLLGGVSRAEMEKERLARVAARQAAQQADGRNLSSVTGIRSSTTPVVASASKSASTSTSSKVATLSSLASSDETTPSLPHTQSNGAKVAQTSRFGTLSGLAQKSKNTMYWDGIVRPTSSQFHSGYERFTFADVIGNVGLKRMTRFEDRNNLIFGTILTD